MSERLYGIMPCTEGPISFRIKRYRERADTLKLIADEVLVERERQTLLRIATTYEAMANQAARTH